jgi:hypothetical protein
MPKSKTTTAFAQCFRIPKRSLRDPPTPARFHLFAASRHSRDQAVVARWLRPKPAIDDEIAPAKAAKILSRALESHTPTGNGFALSALNENRAMRPSSSDISPVYQYPMTNRARKGTVM